MKRENFTQTYIIDKVVLEGKRDHAQLKILGNLRSNDADGSEKVKITIGFTTKTTTLHASRLLDVNMPKFASYGVGKQATTKFYLFFFKLGYGPLEFNSRRVRLHLTK